MINNSTDTKIMYAMLDEGEQYRALNNALEKLSEKDRLLIDWMADELISVLKAKRPNTRLSRDGVLHLLAHIGIAMNDTDDKNMRRRHKTREILKV